MTSHSPDSALRRLLAKPPRVVGLLAGFWALALIVTHSDAGVAFPMSMALMGGGLLLAAWWTVRALMALGRSWTHDGSFRLRPLRWWLVAPVSMTLAVVVASSSIPLQLRVRLSAGALRESAPALARIPENDLYRRPVRVGLFRVREFAEVNGSLWFKTSECGLVDACGVIYAPNGPPTRRGEDTFRHLFGDWWHWHESW